QSGTGKLVSEAPLLKSLQIDTQSLQDQTGLDAFAVGMARIVESQAPVALLADFASRIVNRPDSLASPEQRCFTRALVLSHEAKAKAFGTPPTPFYNTVVWIVDKEGDLPDWFLISNPRIRHIPVPKPDHVVRRQICSGLLVNLEGFSGATEEGKEI